MNFHFITVVWGHSHTESFLDVTLPSQLGEGNLPDFDTTNPYVYKIFTRKDDAEFIRKSSTYHLLSETIKTEIILMDDVISNTFPLSGQELISYNIASMNACQSQALIDANKVDSAVFILSPDVVYATNTFYFVNFPKTMNPRESP